MPAFSVNYCGFVVFPLAAVENFAKARLRLNAINAFGLYHLSPFNSTVSPYAGKVAVAKYDFSETRTENRQR